MTPHQPDIFDIESDWLDRKLMAFAPEPIDLLPDDPFEDDPIDDQSLDDLFDEIQCGLSGGDDGGKR
jgi:hypothetical protein